jgi:hypothetical protein
MISDPRMTRAEPNERSIILFRVEKNSLMSRGRGVVRNDMFHGLVS